MKIYLKLLLRQKVKPMHNKATSPVSITGSTLKLIAVITMLIDHMGAALVGPLRHKLPDGSALGDFCIMIYPHMRNIGRLAFPIFCFLLVEGFLHTRNVRKYASRMFVFALISELPFDYAFSNQLLRNAHQNVYFTLLIGLLVMMGMSYFEFREPRTKVGNYLNFLMQIFIAAVGLWMADFLHTDYNYKGVFLIIVLYSLRLDRRLQAIFGAITISWEMYAPFAFIPVLFYNGQRGRQMKYFFYWFYPVHLLILGFLRHVVIPHFLI